MVNIISLSKAEELSKVTGKIYFTENLLKRVVMFTDASGAPEGYSKTDGYWPTVAKIPSKLLPTDPKEHKPLNNVKQFVDYYFKDYTIIQE